MFLTPPWTDLELLALIGVLDEIEILIQLGLCFLPNFLHFAVTVPLNNSESAHSFVVIPSEKF